MPLRPSTSRMSGHIKKLRPTRRSAIRSAGVFLSAGGEVPAPTLSVYGMTKAAVIHLTRYHALELGPDIRVNSVCPGPIETDMLRRLMVELDGNLEDGRKNWAAEVAGLKRLGRVDEVAGSVLFLASDLASYMTGTSQVIDGGQTVA
jgi:NAD(P)-dependent dehydrogenase (short-subunit alcohol dehydrogenase family)